MPQIIDAIPENVETEPPHHHVEASRERLHKLAYILDSAIPLPGGYRVGFDGVIGLVPGVGDLAGAALSSYIIAEAHRLGAPTVVLIRMTLNMLFESVVGVIPVFGDLFDFAYKANRRNVGLLEEHMARPHELRRQSRWAVAGVAALLVGMTVLVFALVLSLLRWVIGAL